MTVQRKMHKNYDARQREYDLMMKNKEGDAKARQRMETGGYKRPGSRNPRKARAG